MKNFAKQALDTAVTRGATYADVRVVGIRDRFLSTKNGEAAQVRESDSLGLGIRAIADGAWGFAATDELTHASIDRTAARAVTLAENLGDQVIAVPWEAHTKAMAEAALVVNATTLGMKGQPETELDLSNLPKTAVVTDIVYAPLETPLLAAAKARGNLTVDGLGMLIHQARPGFEAWFGRLPDADGALRKFLIKALDGR